jgi:integrase
MYVFSFPESHLDSDHEYVDTVKRSISVTRAIWEGGDVTDPKTRKSKGAIPVIPYVAKYLDKYRVACGNPQSGPMFKSTAGTPLNINNVLNRQILPTLNICKECKKPESEHGIGCDHAYERNDWLPEWRGWHACRRGLGSNLYALGVPEKVIQEILRHANVSTTMTYYVKTTSQATEAAMAKLENSLTVSYLSANSDDRNQVAKAN